MGEKEKIDVDMVYHQVEATADLSEMWTEFVAVTAGGEAHELTLTHEV